MPRIYWRALREWLDDIEAETPDIREEFLVDDLADEDALLAHIGVAWLPAHTAWSVCFDSPGGDHQILTHGRDADLQECIYCGGPMDVQAACLLSREDVETALHILETGQPWAAPWRLLPIGEAFVLSEN